MKKENKKKPSKNKYKNNHKGIGKNYKDNVQARQQQLIILLGQGMNIHDIARYLEVSIQTIYNDKQELSKQGLNNLRQLGSAELAFYYGTIVSSINENKQFLRMIIKDSVLKNSGDLSEQPITIDHKLKASRTLNELDRDLLQVYNATVNSIIIPDYTKRLSHIEEILVNEGLEDNNRITTQQDNNKENKKIRSFMNLKRPSLIKDNTQDNSNNDSGL